jgi:protein SCO1/2
MKHRASLRSAVKLHRRSVMRLGLGAAALLLAACKPNKLSFSSVDVTGADYGKSFELSDHNGQVRHLTDFAGKVVVMFFGYTQCPDVCPATMIELAQVKKLLGADGDRLQALFVTLDPERDTPELLQAYMVNFDPMFLALRPTPEQLPVLAKDFKIYYKKVAGKTADSYTMDHSAGSYVFDTKGQMRLFTRYGGGAPVLAADIALLLK